MVSVVMTTLGRPDMLRRFFTEGVRPSGEVEYVIVDNGSNQTTCNMLKFIERAYGARVILNGENKGFGSGNNQGVAAAKGNVLVITQPDVLFLEDITPWLAQIQDDVLYGHALIDFDSGWNKFGSTVVSYLVGYFLACTRNTWNKLGGFDPLYYPADYEDVDLSFTAVQRDITLKALPIRMIHTSGSSWAAYDNRVEVTRRNMHAFAKKWGFE